MLASKEPGSDPLDNWRLPWPGGRPRSAGSVIWGRILAANYYRERRLRGGDRARRRQPPMPRKGQKKADRMPDHDQRLTTILLSCDQKFKVLIGAQVMGSIGLWALKSE